MHVWLNLKTIKFYLKISHRFLLTNKLITGWKSLIWKKPKKYSLKYLGHQQWLELAYTCLGNLGLSISATTVSYPMLRMTHPSRNFFVLSLFCVYACLYGQEGRALRVQLIKCSRRRSLLIQKQWVLKRKLVQQELTWHLVKLQPSKKTQKYYNHCQQFLKRYLFHS